MNRDSRISFVKRSAATLSIAVLSLGTCLGISAPAKAGVINYTVTINTNDLAGAPASGPFASYFSFFDQNNQVDGNGITASNFNFGGGSSAAPNESFGSAGGDYAASIFANDAAGAGSNSYYIQQFNPGGILSFDLAVNVVNATAGGGFSTDLFSFSFLENYAPLGGSNIPTTSPNNDLFTIDFDDLSNPTVTPFAGTGAYNNVNVNVAQVLPSPEPGTWAMMLMGLAGVAFCAWRRKQKGAPIECRASLAHS